MRLFVIGHKSPDLDTVVSATMYSDFLNQIKRYPEYEIIPAIAGEPNKETQMVYEKFNIQLPKNISTYTINDNDKFVLVDHNELAQRADEIRNDKILEILDHHRVVVDFTTPIYITVRPLGANASVIYREFELEQIQVTPMYRTLVLSAIISDTQGLKSSTTTHIDIDLTNKLSAQVNINLNELIYEIFKAKSDITGATPEQLTRRDCKTLDFNGNKIFINQIETVEPEKLISMKQELIGALEKVKYEEKANYGIIVITDILNNTSSIIATEAEIELISNSFNTSVQNNVADIGALTSRKKDIVPRIEKFLTAK